jgi:ribosomal protein L7/L12
MTIIGWRRGVDAGAATAAIRKHTGMSLVESKKLVDSAIAGTAVKLPDDFVLREDLEDCNFIIS